VDSTARAEVTLAVVHPSESAVELASEDQMVVTTGAGGTMLMLSKYAVCPVVPLARSPTYRLVRSHEAVRDARCVQVVASMEVSNRTVDPLVFRNRKNRPWTERLYVPTFTSVRTPALRTRARRFPALYSHSSVLSDPYRFPALLSLNVDTFPVGTNICTKIDDAVRSYGFHERSESESGSAGIARRESSAEGDPVISQVAESSGVENDWEKVETFGGVGGAGGPAIAIMSPAALVDARLYVAT
jgi:hypothetical protein